MRPQQKELEHISALLEATENEADEIVRTMPKAKGIIATKLEQQADEVDRRYKALTARKAELEEILALELTDTTIDDLLLFRETVATGLESPTFEDKQRWLEILQVAVTVKDRIAVVSCRLGGRSLQYRLTDVNKMKT